MILIWLKVSVGPESSGHPMPYKVWEMDPNMHYVCI